MAITLKDDAIHFEFPEVHANAKFSLEFQRTLRIPDDGKDYPLPPGLGKFPMRLVEDFKDRVPAKWNERQGVMLPLYQSEALWIRFQGHYSQDRRSAYPFAVKIAAGKRCAITGKAWWPKPRGNRDEQDYVVIPTQPWLDGFAVEKGIIRQFVAVPLGMGLTVEGQLDGKEEFGGIQIQVYPMKADVYERRFPKREMDSRRLCRSKNLGFDSLVDGKIGAAAADMGLGAGGRMKQEITTDPFGLDDWNTDHTSRVFCHLANSLAWRAITQQDPPYPPRTAADYTRAGLPWFDYYAEGTQALEGGALLSTVKSVLAMGFQKGLSGIIPENESVTVPSDQIKVIQAKRPGEISNGTW